MTTINGLEALAAMTYPGRFIILGRDKSQEQGYVAVYGMTGRSPENRARSLGKIGSSLSKTGLSVTVHPLANSVVDKSRHLYTAMHIDSSLAVGNGEHVEDIRTWLGSQSRPTDVLVKALHKWDCEDVQPNYTPRIGGCIIKDELAFSIIRRIGETEKEIEVIPGQTERREVPISSRAYFEFPLERGVGYLIATYNGHTTRKHHVPPFQGEPRIVTLDFGNARKLAKAVYDVLAPEEGHPDLRIGVAAAYRRPQRHDVSIINVHKKARR